MSYNSKQRVVMSYTLQLIENVDCTLGSRIKTRIAQTFSTGEIMLAL